jgi:hypothetical protein
MNFCLFFLEVLGLWFQLLALSPAGQVLELERVQIPVSEQVLVRVLEQAPMVEQAPMQWWIWMLLEPVLLPRQVYSSHNCVRIFGDEKSDQHNHNFSH